MIILSDICVLKEPDDTQSFVRFLLYSNEFDIEGILGRGSKYGPLRGDIAYFEMLIDAYGQVRNNLQIHSSGYPTVDQFKSVLRHVQREV
ncbi:nucleoside hydrolase-like domain-containing protein [Algoriphagus antarcticus]|uniref:nucleoside hydrolase-like domain-containing protein n=1 Tax=Algoriphagus antarcticus TaxID=238540 RepID=UPI000A39FCEA